MRAIRNTAILALGALALAGCKSGPGPLGGSPNLQVVQGELPPPTPADLYASADFGGIRPFDTLTIDVFGIPELSNRRVRVDANGEIGFPLIGNIGVSGLSTAEISQAIEGRLKGRFIRDPQVTTNLVSSENRTFTVYGEVNQPGVFPVVGEATLIEAVATARGLSQYSNARDVIVFRTVGGQRMATLYNLDAISRGAYDDPRIYPNDTVVVGDSDARRLFDDVVGVATILVTPLTILLNR
ncbi:polysaccharide biosynthesis/export family protein [Erythrobacter sp. JK5]|uniref:polysaccharide biosynthesis/export family protein n=1 Tax=Erythrobacter sp. JK5 TaxID=2829500 RepID=UPI0020118FCF|nr:polysaccharide biosynthesis/export family protein [Erythrobacter sp. JK5]